MVNYCRQLYLPITPSRKEEIDGVNTINRSPKAVNKISPSSLLSILLKIKILSSEG
jgi:hypothetical protein